MGVCGVKEFICIHCHINCVTDETMAEAAGSSKVQAFHKN